MVAKWWLLFTGLDYWTDMLSIFTNVVVSLIDSHCPFNGELRAVKLSDTNFYSGTPSKGHSS